MLFIVATPIGNLADISLRAIDTLKSVDIVACEDTRHTKILLDKYEIKAKTIAYHKFNERTSTEGIIKLLKENKSVALVSDAGMPLICDPGNILINRLIEENIDYTVVPGANALLCALVMSGFDSSSFAFFGFLKEKSKDKIATINKISNFNGTSILYSSKYNVNDDLAELRKNLSNRKVCVVNEISKVFEKKVFFDLKDANITEPAGEYVIVLSKPFEEENKVQDIDVNKEIKNLVASGVSVNEACKQIAKDYGLSKREIYNQFISASK